LDNFDHKSPNSQQSINKNVGTGTQENTHDSDTEICPDKLLLKLFGVLQIIDTIKKICLVEEEGFDRIEKILLEIDQ
jgi:hypothetical protein